MVLRLSKWLDAGLTGVDDLLESIEDFGRGDILDFVDCEDPATEEGGGISARNHPH